MDLKWMTWNTKTRTRHTVTLSHLPLYFILSYYYILEVDTSPSLCFVSINTYHEGENFVKPSPTLFYFVLLLYPWRWTPHPHWCSFSINTFHEGENFVDMVVGLEKNIIHFGFKGAFTNLKRVYRVKKKFILI